MRTHRIESMGQLLDIVGASGPDGSLRGPKVVRITLWDGRAISASYYKGPKYQHPDAETEGDVFWDLSPLIPLVERLLATGESFVTVTGTDDMVCALEWSIETA